MRREQCLHVLRSSTLVGPCGQRQASTSAVAHPRDTRRFREEKFRRGPALVELLQQQQEQFIEVSFSWSRRPITIRAPPAAGMAVRESPADSLQHGCWMTTMVHGLGDKGCFPFRRCGQPRGHARHDTARPKPAAMRLGNRRAASKQPALSRRRCSIRFRSDLGARKALHASRGSSWKGLIRDR